MKARKIVSSVLALCMAVALCACGKNNTAPAATDAPATQAPAETKAPVTSTPAASGSDLLEAAELDKDLPIRVVSLANSYGYGVAKMVHDAAAGDAKLNYQLKVASDADEIMGMLKNGEADFAAVPTTFAAHAYNELDGGVQVIALNMEGTAYLAVNTEKEHIESAADLEGKTVYSFSEAFDRVFYYVTNWVGVNAKLDDSYTSGGDLMAAMLAGKVDLAILPAGAMTALKAADPKFTDALNFTDEWEKTAPAGTLVQGCMVVRKDFAAQHPAETYAFMKDYGESIAFLTVNPESAGEMIAKAGLAEDAAMAAQVIPECKVCFVTGFKMWDRLSRFYELTSDYAEVQEPLPEDDFYYFPG